MSVDSFTQTMTYEYRSRLRAVVRAAPKNSRRRLLRWAGDSCRSCIAPSCQRLY